MQAHFTLLPCVFAAALTCVVLRPLQVMVSMWQAPQAECRSCLVPHPQDTALYQALEGMLP
jgi:hypothetical protein